MSIGENTAINGYLPGAEQTMPLSRSGSGNDLFSSILASATSKPGVTTGADYNAAKASGYDFVQALSQNALINQSAATGSIQDVLGYNGSTKGTLTTTTDKGTVIGVAGDGTGKYVAQITRDNGLQININLTQNTRVNELEDGGLSVYYPETGATHTFSKEGVEKKTMGDEKVYGTATNDIIFNMKSTVTDAGDGDDLIFNFAANSTLSGGNGNDRIFLVGDGQRFLSIGGGAGQDLIAGDMRNSVIDMGMGSDAVIGNISDTRLTMGAGLNKHVLGDITGSTVFFGGDSNTLQSGTVLTTNIRFTPTTASDAAISSGIGTTTSSNIIPVIYGKTETIAERETTARKEIEKVVNEALKASEAAKTALAEAKGKVQSQKDAISSADSAKQQADAVVTAKEIIKNAALEALEGAMALHGEKIKPFQEIANETAGKLATADSGLKTADKNLKDAKDALELAKTAETTAKTAEEKAKTAVETAAKNVTISDEAVKKAQENLEAATTENEVALKAALATAEATKKTVDKAFSDSEIALTKSHDATTKASQAVIDKTSPIAGLETAATEKQSAYDTAKTENDEALTALKEAKKDVIPFEEAATAATDEHSQAVQVASTAAGDLATAKQALTATEADISKKTAALEKAVKDSADATEKLASWSNSFGTPADQANTFTMDAFIALHNNFVAQHVA